MAAVREGLRRNRDLVAVTALVATAVATSTIDAAGSGMDASGSVPLPLALLLLLILPGYVTTTFASAVRDRDRWALATVTKQLALAVGGSLAILPVVAILTYLSGVGLTPVTLVGAVSVYVLVGVGATALRRRGAASSGGRSSATGSTRTTTATASRLLRRARPLQLVLALSVVVAVGTLGVAVAVPSHGETTSDLHLLTEQNGRLVADEYPSTLSEGGAAPITVGVTNDEHQPVAYTVVAELQRVTVVNRTVVVEERQRVDRYAFALAHGETRRQQLELRGTLTGENLRFTVYLYRGEAPQSPTAASAYRTTYIWLDVQPANGA